MKQIPVWLTEIASRSRISDDYQQKGMIPGYTLIIRKRTAYENVCTFRKEIDHLLAYCKRNFCEAEVIDFPYTTHHVVQTAQVIVFDPVMRWMEPYLMDEHKEDRK